MGCIQANTPSVDTLDSSWEGASEADKFELERASDAFQHCFFLFVLLPALLSAQGTFLLAFIFTLQEFLDFVDAHACTDPPPAAEEALPQGERPHEFWHPGILVLAGGVEKVERGGYECENDSTCAKCGCSTISVPSLAMVDEEAPEDERECEEDSTALQMLQVSSAMEVTPWPAMRGKSCITVDMMASVPDNGA